MDVPYNKAASSSYDYASGRIDYQAYHDLKDGKCNSCRRRRAMKARMCRQCYNRYTGSPKPIRGGQLPGRNEPCPCGSGMKFKLCCLRRRRWPSSIRTP